MPGACYNAADNLPHLVPHSIDLIDVRYAAAAAGAARLTALFTDRQHFYYIELSSKCKI